MRSPLRLGKTLAAIAMAVIAVVFAAPLLWMFMSGFKSNAQIFAEPFAPPQSLDPTIWAKAWEVGNIGTYALNSVTVTAVSVTLILVASAAVAFAISRYRFRGRRVILAVLSLGLLLPLQSYFIAQSTMFRELELTDTLWALILPYAAMGLPLATFLLIGYLDALPAELFEAARLDGASDIRIFAAIVLPMLKPALGTVAIFSALSTWNEFLLALLYIQSDELKTLPVGLLAFQSRYVTDYGLLFAALSIVTLPMIIVFIAFNRRITESATAGSLR